MADTQDFIDTLDSSTPLSQLEQARPTANGQNFRAPGFIGNYDRAITDNAVVPPTAPTVQAPAPATPMTALRTIGVPTNQEGGGGGGAAGGGDPNASATPAISGQDALAGLNGKIGNISMSDVLSNALPAAIGIANPIAGLIAKGIATAITSHNNSADTSASTPSSANPGTNGDPAPATGGIGTAAPSGGSGPSAAAAASGANPGSNGDPEGGSSAPGDASAGSADASGSAPGSDAAGANGGSNGDPGSSGADGSGAGDGSGGGDGGSGDGGGGPGAGGGGAGDGPGYAMGGVVGGRRLVGPVRRGINTTDPQGSAPGQFMAMGGAVRRLVGPQRGRPTMQQGPEDRTQGGPVTGSGTWNSDNIDTKTSPGEEIIPANVRAYYGQKFFDDLIENFEQKTGQKRGTDQYGKPPSPAAQASFRRTQEPDADDRGGPPDGDADDTQQPEATNPRQTPQGTPLMAAGPTMAPVMAMGGVVPNLGQMSDDDLTYHARMTKARGDRAGHEAASQEIARRLRGQNMAMGGQVPSTGIPGGASPQTGRAQYGGRGPSALSTSAAPVRSAGFGSGIGGSGVHVPAVRSTGGATPGPAMPINAPGPRPQAMPTPPAVVGQGPAMSVAPPPAMARSPAPPKIASPSATGMPRQPRTALGMIGRSR